MNKCQANKCINRGTELCAKCNAPYRPLQNYHSLYVPTCPQGQVDCIHDPAYIQYFHPEWYTELYGELTPEEVSKQYCDIDDDYCYDDEDK